MVGTGCMFTEPLSVTLETLTPRSTKRANDVKYSWSLCFVFRVQGFDAIFYLCALSNLNPDTA